MIDDFIRETTLATGDLVRSRRKRIAMAAALALSSLAVIVVIGDASWGTVLLVLCIAGLFWLFLTILEMALNMFSSTRED